MQSIAFFIGDLLSQKQSHVFKIHNAKITCWHQLDSNNQKERGSHIITVKKNNKSVSLQNSIVVYMTFTYTNVLPESCYDLFIGLKKYN